MQDGGPVASLGRTSRVERTLPCGGVVVAGPEIAHGEREVPEDAEKETFVLETGAALVVPHDEGVEAAELAVLHVDGDGGRSALVKGEDGDEMGVMGAEAHGLDFAFGVAGEGEALFDVGFPRGEVLDEVDAVVLQAGVALLG